MSRSRSLAALVLAGALLGLVVPFAAAEEQPVITTTSVSFVQHEFGSVLLEASPPHPYGDPCAYQWIHLTGPLPGLEVTRWTGRIRGTPTAYGEFHPQIKLYRAESPECGPLVQVVQEITVTVAPAAPVLSGGELSVVYGEDVHATPLAVTGGTPPYSWSMTPAHGLTIDPATGEVRGAPTIAYVEKSLPVTVTDADGDSTTGSIRVAFHPDVPDRTLTLVRGRQYDLTIPLLADTVPPTSDVVWSTAGVVPGGLELTTDGRLVGTPTTEGTTSFPAKAFMEIEHWETPNNIWYETWFDTGAQTIVVTRPSVRWATSRVLPRGTKGRALAATLRSADGWGRHTYRVVRGALPPGTDLARTGRRSIELRGRPTRAGAFEFRVRVRDARGEVKGRTFAITIRRR